MFAAQLAALVTLILIHVFTAEMRFLDGTPRAWSLSVAGGVSVAYVFVHLLPNVAAAQEALDFAWISERLADHDVWLVLLSGLLVFYGLDRLVHKDDHLGEDAAHDEAEQHTAFWLHLATFSVYNAITGYLLVHRETEGTRGLVFFTVAMTLHFIVSDYGLTKDYRRAWLTTARWVLVAAITTGFVVGQFYEFSPAILAVISAFLGGGTVLNVLREELPKERKSRFRAFLAGVVGYSVILVFA